MTKFEVEYMRLAPEIKEGNIAAAQALFKFAHSLPADDLDKKKAVDYLYKSRDKYSFPRYRLWLSALYYDSGNIEKHLELLNQLADENYALASYYLGAHYVKSKNTDAALKHFLDSKKQGFLLGGFAYFRLKSKHSSWPISWVFRLKSAFYRFRSLREMEKRGVANEIDVWP